MIDLAGSGTIRPVIDSVLPFARIADGYRVADSGRKRGSVVLTA